MDAEEGLETKKKINYCIKCWSYIFTVAKGKNSAISQMRLLLQSKSLILKKF